MITKLTPGLLYKTDHQAFLLACLTRKDHQRIQRMVGPNGFVYYDALSAARDTTFLSAHYKCQLRCVPPGSTFLLLAVRGKLLHCLFDDFTGWIPAPDDLFHGMTKVSP